MSLSSAHVGYAYQDLLTCYFILQEILEGNKDSLFSIDKKHIYNDRFDDLVIKNTMKIQRKQIKYSDDISSKELAKDDLSNDSNYKLAIYQLYETWKGLNSSNSEFRLCLAWDAPAGENMKKVLMPISNSFSSFSSFSTKLYQINLDSLWQINPYKFNRWDSLKKYAKKNNVDRNDFKQFCNELIIELEFPKASLDFNLSGDLEKILIQQAQKLGIGQYPNGDTSINNFLERLAYKVSSYRAKSLEVTSQKVLADLRVKTDFGKIRQKFEIDQTKNIINDDRLVLFHKNILQNKKTLLLGEPGSGKSWFLTNFINYLKSKTKKVIRHYCFTKTDDENNTKRVSVDTFFGNLIGDILKHYPELEDKKENRFAANLEELNLLLSYIADDFIIIIDGLDHINRTLKGSTILSTDKTKIIEFISQIAIPDNITIVLGSQPVEEVENLVNHFEFVEHKIARWEIEDILLLMDKYTIDDYLLEGQQMSQLLLDKSEGNPLYLTYIIKSLKNESGITFETVEKLPKYDGSLKSYYEYLISQIECNNTSEILSCLDFRVTINELKEIVPMSHHLARNLKILSPVLNNNYSRGGIKLYHESFRRFNLEKLEAIANINEIYKYIIQWLEAKEFYKNSKAYRYLLKYHIKSGQYDKVKEYATNDFLTKSLYNGYSETVIKMNYDCFLKVAKITLDWSLFIFISELNRTLNATISDQRNEFEEHFEQYIESIGFVYGFDRANDILFFDTKQNFSDELTVKAFYILKINGYMPNWKKVEKYFKKITIHNFKFYMCYLIDTNKIDDFMAKQVRRLIKPKSYERLGIFIEEIYHVFGIEKVLQFFDSIELEDKNEIAKNINDILSLIGATESILLKKKIDLELDELNLEILKNSYIQNNELEQFYFNLENYAFRNIEQLKIFNNTIESYDFVTAWIKFSINLFIIENNLSYGKIKNYDDFENKLVNNFVTLQYYKDCSNLIHEHKRIIQKPIFRMFQYVKSKWHDIISILNSLNKSTYQLKSFFYIALVKDFECGENRVLIINEYKKMLEKYEKNSDGYSFLIDSNFNLVLLYKSNNEIDKAKKQLKNAIAYMTAYTFRKDTTLDEIIDPLESISKLDNTFAIKYAKKLLSLNLTVQSHSEDGKGIRWLYINWFKKILKVDDNLAVKFLIRKLLKDEYFWKHEYMFNHFVETSKDLNPVILNTLLKLSPKNIGNDYINSFSDNIYRLLPIDKKLAKSSLINILSRDINKDGDVLSTKTMQKLKLLKSSLNVSMPIKESKKENSYQHLYSDKNIEAKLIEYFGIGESLKNKNTEQLNQYFDKYDNKLDNKDMIFLKYHLDELQDDEITKKVLLPIIRKRLIGKEEFYEKLRLLVKYISCKEELKVFLLINIFVYSQGGWLENFVNQEALKDALGINQSKALNYLAETLEKKFYKIDYYTKCTSGLIGAFEYVRLPSDNILAMYKRAFKFIEYRLPHGKDFDWAGIEGHDLDAMNSDEIAIVFILVKLRHCDKTIQEEILYAINYLINFEHRLLAKPLKWFFQHIEQFPQLSIAGILEIFLLNIDSKLDFFLEIKDDVQKVSALDNLYINNCIEQLYFGA